MHNIGHDTWHNLYYDKRWRKAAQMSCQVVVLCLRLGNVHISQMNLVVLHVEPYIVSHVPHRSYRPRP